MNTIIQKMEHRQSIIKYYEKYGVTQRKPTQADKALHSKAQWQSRRFHRKDNEYPYATHPFYSLEDCEKLLAVHNSKYNNFPMRPPH